MPTLHIELQAQSHDILIGSEIRKEIQRTVQMLEYKKHSIVVITDQNIEKFQQDFLDEIFGITPRFVIVPGEASKSLSTLENFYEFLINHHIERTSAIFAVGGGVVGDIAGFAAATYMRGIEYYQIPTSLLAMVDSSIGGKTGINLKSGKNLIGAFYQPKGIFTDAEFLKTLAPREFTSGMAEIIKYALLQDKDLFEHLEKSPVIDAKSPEIIPFIERCCRIKVSIVEKDEKEQNGTRCLLNLGHTFAHAIEQATGYGEYLHGEAVAIGLVMAARLSELLGYIDEREVSRIKTVIQKYGLPIKFKTPIPIVDLQDALHRDKKIEARVLHFIVLHKIGEAKEDKNANERMLHVLWREVDGED